MNKSKEDYIKAIYELGGYKSIVANKSISKKLKISAPSVSEMIKKLVKDKLVEYEEYRGVKLTEYGIKEARKIRKRHLLWEVFLVEKLGYNWEDVDEEAERLEHVTDNKLESRLDEFLGYPKTCPHGTPMELGSIKEEKPLLDLSKGDKFKVIRVTDRKKVLHYLSKNNIRLGTRLRVEDVVLEGIYVKDTNNKTVYLENEYLGDIFIKQEE